MFFELHNYKLQSCKKVRTLLIQFHFLSIRKFISDFFCFLFLKKISNSVWCHSYLCIRVSHWDPFQLIIPVISKEWPLSGELSDYNNVFLLRRTEEEGKKSLKYHTPMWVILYYISCSQFYQLLTSSFFADLHLSKKLQTQTVSTEKLFKTLSHEKGWFINQNFKISPIYFFHKKL